LLQLVDSTSLALQRLPAEEQHGHAVVADGQYAGRGRRGRSWYSPPGQNIYLSLGWNFQRAAAALTQLPLAIAVTVARALQRAGVVAPGIKWPNDIQVDGSKLGGILVELRNTGPEQALAVIGIGINVRMAADDTCRTALGQPWTDVCSHLIDPAGEGLRNRLCGLLLDELLQGVGQFVAQGFRPFAADWGQWDALRGRVVTVASANETVSGIAAGISTSGGLLLDCQAPSGATQTREFFAGDVSVRPTVPL
jgi:BirA family biotin operon repressor/biotin-[acetyl-CoA-carboxylase] ligase